jgi:hypothetical protein
MSDNPIKFLSSPLFSEDELLSHHSSKENVSSDDGMFDYSPPWSSKKEDLEEEDKDDANVEDDDDDSDDNSMTLTLTSPRLLPSERGNIFRLSSL